MCQSRPPCHCWLVPASSKWWQRVYSTWMLGNALKKFLLKKNEEGLWPSRWAFLYSGGLFSTNGYRQVIAQGCHFRIVKFPPKSQTVSTTVNVMHLKAIVFAQALYHSTLISAWKESFSPFPTKLIIRNSLGILTMAHSIKYRIVSSDHPSWCRILSISHIIMFYSCRHGPLQEMNILI